MSESKYGSFKLNFRLGDDAMQTNEDIARTLRKLADSVEAGQDNGAIIDDNGNSIGRFEFEAWSESAIYDSRRDNPDR